MSTSIGIFLQCLVKTHINFYLYQSPKKKRGHPWNRAGNCKTTQWIGPPEFIKSRYWMARKATGKAIKGQNHEIVDIPEYIFAQIWSVLQTVELVLHGAWPRVEQSGSKGFFLSQSYLGPSLENAWYKRARNWSSKLLSNCQPYFHH